MSERGESEYRDYASARATQLFRLAFLMCGDWHEAEDLVQTTLASLFVAWNRVRRRGSMDTYARRVLVNAFLSQRRLKRSREMPTAQFADLSAPPVDADLRLTLVAALRMLPPRSRAVVVLRYLEDHSIDYNDGQGAVDLIINVSPTATYPSDSPLNCPKPLWTNEGPRPAGALPISCVMRTLPDGSMERDAVMYADAYGFYGYNIYDQRPDGITVFLQVANGTNHFLPQVDRPRPPGTLAEWEELVENPAWHLKKGWHLRT